MDEGTPAKVFLKDFGDFAIYYEIKFYMDDHSRIQRDHDSIRTNVWYDFKRQKITIPFPIRTLEVNRKRAIKPHEEHDRARLFWKANRSSIAWRADQLDISFADRARSASVAAKNSSSREPREPRCSSCSMVRRRFRFRRMAA